MSASCIRMLISRIPKFSLRGVAYLSAANFLARVIILLKYYVVTYFHSEMIIIYGATLDTRILLFFQAIYMVPMFLLGILVFFGIERESFNLVLYPTLMLLFLILIRYGSEAALITVHWEHHKFDQTPEMIFTLVQDVIFVALLLLYIYVCLAFTPIKPTPLELVEGGNNALASAAAAQGNVVISVPTSGGTVPSTSLQVPQNHSNAPDPDSQGFNYALRRNVDQIPKDSQDKAMLDEIERQRQRNSLILREGVIETDLDAVHSQSNAAAADDEPVTVVKLPKLKKAAATKKEPEKPPEPEVDFWGSMNGDTDTNSASKSESFKTTSV